MRSLPAWAWIGLLAAALRLVGIGAENLWYDESFTWWVTRLLDGPRFWQAIAGDVHPPLYYLVQVACRFLGDSEAALRLPSACFGIAAVLMVYRVARVYLDERGALLAEIIAALLPMAGLYYSQEARMYSLLTLLLLIALYAALRRRWLLYAGAAGLAAYTQNLAVVYVTVIGLVSILADREAWRKALLANAAVAAAWLPWGIVMLSQMRGMEGTGFWLWPLQDLGEVLLPLPAMTVGFRMPGWAQLQAFILAFALTLVSLVAVFRHRLFCRPMLLLLAVTFGAPAILVLVSLTWRSVYLPRAMIVSAMTLSILWACGITRLSTANRRIAFILLGFVLGVGVVGHYFPETPGDRQPVEAWLTPVREGWREGDVIYHPSLLTEVMSRYYTGDLQSLVWNNEHIEQGLSAQTRSALGFDYVQSEELEDTIRYRRAWVLWQTHPLSIVEEQAAVLDFVGSHPNRLVSTLYETQLGDVALYEVDLTRAGFYRVELTPAAATVLGEAAAFASPENCGFAWGPQMIDAGSDFLESIGPLSECALLAAEGRNEP